MNEVLSAFRACFSRTATFEWFVVIIVGFMLRSDHLGVTSVIRDLALNNRCYETLIHFFRSSTCSLESLRTTWSQVVRKTAPLLVVDGRALLLLNRYFLSVPALERLNAFHHASAVRMLVTKAKSNVVAYERPETKKPGRGRPPKKGKVIKLKDVFATRAADF